MNAEQIWLSVAIVMFILEVITPGFVLANFGVAAIVAAVAAWMGFDLVVQLIVFSVTCLVSFALLRPILRRTVLRSAERIPTGVDALVGREAIVSEAINGGLHQGRVQIDGDSWRAIAVDRNAIGLGAHVQVQSVDSTTLIVKQVSEEYHV